MLKIAKIILDISNSTDRRLLGLFFFVSVLAAVLEVSLIYVLGLLIGKLEAVAIQKIEVSQLISLLSILTFSLIVQISNIRLQAYTATSIGVRWSTHVFKTLYSARYRSLSDLKGADIINYCVTETSRFTDYVALPALQLFSRFLLVCVISAIIILKFPFLTAVFLTAFVIIYLLIFFLVRIKLNMHSGFVSEALEERNNIVLTSFLNLKTTLLKRDIREKTLRDFQLEGEKIISSQSFTYTAVQFPRYAIEFVLLSICACIFYFGLINISFITFGFAGFRLLPNLQAIYASFASIQAARTTFEKVNSYFDSNLVYEGSKGNNAIIDSAGDEKIHKVNSISFEKINFEYEKTSVFNDFSFTADLSEKPLMIVGKTGCGKSTLIDLLCGLYPEYYSKIKVNGVRYSNINITDFQSELSYIPQMLFCRKANLWQYLEEIGASPRNSETVDLFRKLNLKFLVNNDYLPDMKLEENFKNLSGGQRQRLILALAILSKPKLLILDEATNALDDDTEKMVLETIISLGIPLILITHHPVFLEKFNVLRLGE